LGIFLLRSDYSATMIKFKQHIDKYKRRSRVAFDLTFAKQARRFLQS